MVKVVGTTVKPAAAGERAVARPVRPDPVFADKPGINIRPPAAVGKAQALGGGELFVSGAVGSRFTTTQVQVCMIEFICATDSRTMKERHDQIAAILLSHAHDQVVGEFLSYVLNDQLPPIAQENKALGEMLAQAIAIKPLSRNPLAWIIAVPYYYFTKNWDQAIKYGLMSANFHLGTAFEHQDNFHVGSSYFWKASDIAEGFTERVPEVVALFKKARPYLLMAGDKLSGSHLGNQAHCELLEVNSYLGLHRENVRLALSLDHLYGEELDPKVALHIYKALISSIPCLPDIEVGAIRVTARCFEIAMAHRDECGEQEIQFLDVSKSSIGVVYTLLGKAEDGITWIKAKENWQTDPTFIFMMIQNCYLLGRLDEAKQWFETLVELDPNYSGVEKCRQVLYPEAQPQLQTASAVREKPEVQPVQQVEARISGEAFKCYLFLNTLSTSSLDLSSVNRPTRQAMERALIDTSEEYRGFLTTYTWDFVLETLRSNPDALPLVDPRVNAMLHDLFGISRVDIVINARSVELRIFTQGGFGPTQYFPVTVTEKMELEYSDQPALGLFGELLRASLYDCFVSLILGGTSFGLVSQALEVKSQAADDHVDWAQIGKAAKVERAETERRRKEEEARQQAEQDRLRNEEEERRLATAEGQEAAFLTSNSELFIDLALTIDSAGIDLLAVEERLDQAINAAKVCLTSFREIDAPITSFNVPVPTRNTIGHIVREVRIYGPNQAEAILGARRMLPATIAALGLGNTQIKNPFSGIYEFVCVIDGQEKTLLASLDARGKDLKIFGLEEKDVDVLTLRALQKEALEALVRVTVRTIKDAFIYEPPPAWLQTQRAAYFRPAVMQLAESLQANAEETATVSALMESSYALDRLRIQTEGLERQPLYVRRRDGSYLQVLSNDPQYFNYLLLPPEQKFVKIGPAWSRRLPVGTKRTPSPRNRVKDQPFFHALSFKAGRRAEGQPDWNPMTLSRVLGVSSPDLHRYSLMPYTLSDGLVAAYERDVVHALDRNLASTLMVYAVVGLDDGKTVLAIPRNITGDGIDAIMGALSKRQGQITFLQQFAAGMQDEAVLAALAPSTRARIGDAKPARRMVLVMPSNRGLVQGRFESHVEYLAKQPAREQATFTGVLKGLLATVVNRLL